VTNAFPTGGSTRGRPWRRRPDVLAGLAVALLVLLGGVAFWAINPTQYRAASTLLVFPDAAAGEFAGYYDTLSRGQVTLTFAQILELQVAGDAEEDAERVAVAVEAVPDTSLITVSATAGDAAAAEAAADEVLDASRRYFDQLSSPYEISVVREASGTAKRSGVPLIPLLAIVPFVALITGLAALVAVRALSGAARLPLRLPGGSPQPTDAPQNGAATPEGRPGTGQPAPRLRDAPHSPNGNRSGARTGRSKKAGQRANG